MTPPRAKSSPIVLAHANEDLRFVRAAFCAMRDLVAVCDPYGRVTLINNAMALFSGIDARGALPEPWTDYGEISHLDGEPIADGADPMSRALRGETVRDVEMIMISKSGQRRKMIIDGEPLLDESGGLLGAIVVWHDITDAGSPRTAPLSGPSRCADRTPESGPVRSARPRCAREGAVAPGMDGGARCEHRSLRRHCDTPRRPLGRSLRRCVCYRDSRRIDESLRRRTGSRSIDTLAHTGGDNFLVLCEDVADVSAAKMIARRIAGALVAPMSLAGEELSVTACIGITLTRDPGREPEPLIRESEAAMQRAQRRGAGRHEMFTGEMHAQRLVRTPTSRRCRGTCPGGVLCGLPAQDLPRHRQNGRRRSLDSLDAPGTRTDRPTRLHPTCGGVGNHRADRDLGARAGMPRRRSLAHGAPWWSTAHGGCECLSASVRIGSRRAFGGIIGCSGIDPATVCLEVTESMVMQDADLAIATLRELKSLGLSISVDDFGTGFSSLAYLKRFPLDELKIDKSFVDGLLYDFEATAIVAAVMGMAHALDLRVVAEGVETADQVIRLRTLGCDEAQGFFYARPGPAVGIDARLLAEARANVGGTKHADRKHAESAHIGKILVVDDADDVRQLARSSLAAVGFEVREATTGEDAVTMARHFKPDCLVLDVNLPGISGFDVCRILRDDPANQRTTIVILTGDAAPSEKVMAFSLEADDYMVKPFSPRDLVSRVTAAIRRRGEMFASNPP